MKRVLIAGLSSFLASAMLVPAAQAQTKPKAAAKPAAAKPAAAKPAAAATGTATKTMSAPKAPPGPTSPAATGQTQAAAEAAAPAVKVERGAGGKKVYRITEEIQITGKIQKPEAFYVLQKSGINYEWTELTQDFVPKILDSVAKAPF